MPRDTPIYGPGDQVIFELATGERISVGLPETGLGLAGYQLRIMADRGAVMVQPGGGCNSLDLVTARSFRALEDERERTASERDAARARPKPPGG